MRRHWHGVEYVINMDERNHSIRRVKLAGHQLLKHAKDQAQVRIQWHGDEYVMNMDERSHSIGRVNIAGH